jgi:hypothetical protein|tara:strand:+ start:1125 stop:1628 length:504 start_codon:yes stop_codon:yes gene_type:complete
MPRYASGKHALGISDRSGRTYKLKNMILEWNGYLVGRDEYESKQPQLQPRRVLADPQALRISRPARTEPAVEVLLAFDSFKSGSSGSAVITVTEPGHGRSTGDTVRFRNVEAFDGFTEAAVENSSGFSITKVDSDNYTFTSGSGTATSGNVKGGGGFSSAGPVTVSA